MVRVALLLVLTHALVAGCEAKAPPPTPSVGSAAPAAPVTPVTPVAPAAPPALVAPAAATLGTAPDGTGLALGASIPEISVMNIEGQPVRLDALARDRPLLVVFYRGGWCPYCTTQIRDLTTAHPTFTARGVELAVISVDQPDVAARTEATYKIPFTVLSDPDLAAHGAFHVVHAASPDEVDTLAKEGVDLVAASGRPHHAFAIPSVFLFGADGRLAWRHVDPTFEVRPSAAQLLGVIDQLVAARGAGR